MGLGSRSLEKGIRDPVWRVTLTVAHSKEDQTGSKVHHLAWNWMGLMVPGDTVLVRTSLVMVMEDQGRGVVLEELDLVMAAWMAA